jgi:hypothetical protein
MTDDLKIGDRLLIVNNKLGDRTFSTINVGEIIVITGFGENKKFLYHHGSLGLQIIDGIYIKLEDDDKII